MRTADHYRLQALECFLRATRQSDPSGGYILRGVGDSWLWLAEQAEKHAAAPANEPRH